MRKLVYLIPILWCSLAWGATPGIVSAARCPNSQDFAETGASTYRCPYAGASGSGSLSGDLGVIFIIYDNTNAPTITISDSTAGSNTWTQAVTATSSGNVYRIYYAMNLAAGTNWIQAAPSTTTGYIRMMIAEFNNVATTSALDHAICANVTSATVTSGATGTLTTGDLVLQFAAPNDTTSNTSWTVGSQSNITWALALSDLYDADVMQWGQYNATATFTPTLTQAPSHATASCNAAFKNASAGTAPSSTIKVLRDEHDGMPASAANPFVIQTPALGSTLILAFASGGDTITGITTTPSVTCTSTGTSIVHNTAAQIYYCPLTSTAGNMVVDVTRSGATQDGTFWIEDVSGLNSSPFDADSGGLSGTQGSIVSTIAMCSSCLTPAAANELIVAVGGQDFCTANSVNPPSGAIWDTAIWSQKIDGPSPVDQNNIHWLYFDSSASAISSTTGYNCTGTSGTGQGDWVLRLAAFKPAAGAPSVCKSCDMSLLRLP